MPPMPPTLMAAIFTTSNIRMALIYIVSALLAVAVSVWARCTSHRNFDMCYTFDIALASVDFSGDVLFAMEAFEKGAFVLAVVASALLGLLSLMCLYECFRIIVSYLRDKGSDALLDIKPIESSCQSSLHVAILMFSSTNPELIKLFPWKDHRFDGFPEERLAVRVTLLALMEDIPQLVCQVVFIATVDASATAVVSLVVTVVDLMWRVIRRFFRLELARSKSPGVDPMTNGQVEMDSIRPVFLDRSEPPRALS